MADPGPSVLILMGVSGAGKSTIGTMLSERLGWPFEDADNFHPPTNIAKMSAGTPLTDEDRWPWLHAIAEWIERTRLSGGHGIVGCSALKRRYRDVLVGNAGADVRLVHLRGDEALIAARQAARPGHFMPQSLVRSQFEALEEPDADERVLVVSVEIPPAEIVETIIAELGLQPR